MVHFVIYAVLLLLGALAVAQNPPDLRATCPSFDGNEASCKANSCHWCPCTPKCVSPSMQDTCITSCNGYCGQKSECASHGCIYDTKTDRCYDLDLDTNVDVKAICSTHDCNKEACIANGCVFCRISRTCIPEDRAMKCDPGCRTHCRNVEECAVVGCIYDEKSGECTEDNGDYRYSVNICGDSVRDSKGIWYTSMDKSKIKHLSSAYWHGCYCNAGNVIRQPDRELYQCTMESEEMAISIPIRDAGNYILGIHLAEIYDRINRKEDIYLNGVQIVDDFNFDREGSIGTPHLIKKNFAVNCALTEVTVEGKKAPDPIVNRQVVMRIKALKAFSAQELHSVLNAYYVQKLNS